MREILFRAYDKFEKRMYKIEEARWNCIKELELISVYENDSLCKCYVKNHNSKKHDINALELMQYTGLKDKNGKEIYEGDIVKINAHSNDFGFEEDRIGEIRFLGGAFGFYKQLSEKEYLFNELSIEFAYGELEYYEVIGNIYENPKLLKGE